MEKATIRFSILGALLLLASLVQFLDMTLFGVMPNAVLVVLVLVPIFLRDVLHELLLIASASFLLKFSPLASSELTTFFVISLLVLIVARKLPWHTFVNAIFLVISATLALYAFIDPESIRSLMFVKELGYNVVLTYALYHGLMVMRLFRNV